jgi:glutamate--cysteine ligase
MLDEMRSNREGYHDFTRRLSWQHKTYFDNLPMDATVKQRFQDMAATSHQAQADIETADTGDFGQFLQQYFKQASSIE